MPQDEYIWSRIPTLLIIPIARKPDKMAGGVADLDFTVMYAIIGTDLSLFP
jgi:hypothetical protein